MSANWPVNLKGFLLFIIVISNRYGRVLDSIIVRNNKAGLNLKEFYYGFIKMADSESAEIARKELNRRDSR